MDVDKIGGGFADDLFFKTLLNDAGRYFALAKAFDVGLGAEKRHGGGQGGGGFFSRDTYVNLRFNRRNLSDGIFQGFLQDVRSYPYGQSGLWVVSGKTIA